MRDAGHTGLQRGTAVEVFRFSPGGLHRRHDALSLPAALMERSPIRRLALHAEATESRDVRHHSVGADVGRHPCWGMFRVVEDQEERISPFIFPNSSAISEEAFLIRLRTRVRSLHPDDYTGDVKLQRIDLRAPMAALILFEARVPHTSVMASLACKSKEDCPPLDRSVLRFGSFFDYYRAYWSASSILRQTSS
ncbi:hypothetical protein ACU4GD_30670 [Cupriavidus basilensis]